MLLSPFIQDEDSYVRKTAVLCIVKLYDLTPDLLEEQGFVKLLQNLLNDGNAFVVSNTLAGLVQISEAKGENIINLTPHLV
jgi:vesicle coat complex subunit